MQFRLNIWDVLVLLCVSAVFLILVAPAAGLPSLGDEWLWVYESKLILQGFLPYRDFYHSHAPFHVLAVTLVRLLTGGEYLPAFRLAPALFTLFSGCLVYRTVRRNAEIPFALIACLLFLFAGRILSHSLHFMGWNLLVLFLLIALDQYLSRRMILTGIALGAAVLTNLLGGAGIYAFSILLLLQKDWRSLKRLLIGFCAITLPVALICFAVSGTEFINQIFLYQMSKPPRVDKSRFEVINPQIMKSYYMYVLALVSLVPLVLCRKSTLYRSRTLVSVVLMCIFMLIFLFLIPRPFPYYIITVIPFVSMAAGYGVAWIFGEYKETNGWKKILFGILSVTCILFVLRSTIPNAANFWGLRMGNHENFSITYTIARSVDELLPPGAPIHGTFSVTPMIALLTERRISGNETDTSADRFKSGVTDFEIFIRNVEEDPPGGILVIEGGTIAAYEPYMEYVRNHYAKSLLFHVPGKKIGTVTLWVRDAECTL